MLPACSKTRVVHVSSGPPFGIICLHILCIQACSQPVPACSRGIFFGPPFGLIDCIFVAFWNAPRLSHLPVVGVFCGLPFLPIGLRILCRPACSQPAVVDVFFGLAFSLIGLRISMDCLLDQYILWFYDCQPACFQPATNSRDRGWASGIESLAIFGPRPELS